MRRTEAKRSALLWEHRTEDGSGTERLMGSKQRQWSGGIVVDDVDISDDEVGSVFVCSCTRRARSCDNV